MSALSGPRSDDGGETGTGGPPERHGAVQGITDGDRERAIDVMSRASGDADPFGDVREAIAAALAEERERARAPFLALADDFETGFHGYGHTEREIATLIRETAEETTE